jgi:hypothetical protein
MYVVSEDVDGNLTASTSTLKNNLKIWLIEHKMSNDTIDILDATVINFGIKFKITAEVNKNRYDVLQEAVNTLKDEFLIHQDIGEGISISKIYNLLNESKGVEDTIDVEIIPKVGGIYSDVAFDFKKYITADGRFIRPFDNVIFELKDGDLDIEGSVV